MYIDTEHPRAKQAVVRLDGKVTKWWRWVDTDKGIGERFCTDEKGDPIIVGDELMTEQVTGVFEIEFQVPKL
jgi:hypothetical protein